uniref:Putative ovule protein n=1 Tax=Solanum chacoense TaxID=4108 RepID=A0A0V0H4T6_SOLCH
METVAIHHYQLCKPLSWQRRWFCTLSTVLFLDTETETTRDQLGTTTGNELIEEQVYRVPFIRPLLICIYSAPSYRGAKSATKKKDCRCK